MTIKSKLKVLGLAAVFLTLSGPIYGQSGYSNPFSGGYYQNSNPFGNGYVQDSNPFGSGYVQDKGVLGSFD